MDEQIFTAKTVDEAIENGLTTLGITLDEAEITVLEEGKKKLFGSVKAKVQIKKKGSDAKRAADFIDGLLKILEIEGASEIVDEEENIKIEIKTPTSAKVIGKRGDVLDAIQSIAGAVANTGRDDYKKVVVDCENYRTQREETLKKL
ncbi:MAG: Jag N-terminal domain-containing protein, partial [Clostridia bacterium]|nr:Jag N-terminal domain-containing protein [Clostridia bacterium]